MRQSSLVTVRAVEDGPVRPRSTMGVGSSRRVTNPIAEPTLTPRAPLPASPASPGGETADRLTFDRFVLTPGERLLTRDGAPVELGGRSFDLLLALTEEPGRVIPKRELLRRIWPDVKVEEVALRFHVTRLRKALGDGDDGRRLIATQVGVGYGFVGVVKPVGAAPAWRPAPCSEPLLPGRLDRLIGRAADLRRLVERVPAVRLLTIVGPPGVGKTSLAVEAAHALAPDFADGAAFVDLAAVPAPDMLVPAIAAALGLSAAANSPMTLILDHLRDRRLLLVLDTGEHLVQAIAPLCEKIVATGLETRIIVTSRQALRARSEQVQRLAPHEGPAATDLFRHHLEKAGGAIDLGPGDTATIAMICQRLDGLALPIELAALRAATHGIDETALRLGEAPCLAWPGRRTAPPHQRTLKASLDWSFDLLSDAERAVFEQVSRLDTPFFLEAALEAVVHRDLDRASAAAALDALIEKSLIFLEAGRFRLPEAIRLYARERRAQMEAR